MTDTKMIFFDIDGTLLPEDDYTIPESTKKALRLAKERGHLIFINTGRTYFNIDTLIRNLDFDGYVCGCGTYIYFRNECLFSSTLPRETCIELMEKMRECKIAGLFEANDYIFFDNKYPESSAFVDSFRRVFGLRGDVTPDFFSDERYTFDKVFAKTDERSDIEAFKKYAEPFLEYIDRGNTTVELTQKSCTKGTAIHFLCKHLNIPIENCYAIGDSTNDLGMLQSVPHSIAMGNSMEEILPYCSYITADIKDDGIYKALKHFNLI